MNHLIKHIHAVKQQLHRIQTTNTGGALHQKLAHLGRQVMILYKEKDG